MSVEKIKADSAMCSVDKGEPVDFDYFAALMRSLGLFDGTDEDFVAVLAEEGYLKRVDGALYVSVLAERDRLLEYVTAFGGVDILTVLPAGHEPLYDLFLERKCAMFTG